MGVIVDKKTEIVTDETEDIKITRREADKARTLQRRQARRAKDFMRNNG